MTPDVDTMKLVHADLHQCWLMLADIRERGLPEGCSTDTAYAIGESAGVISRAKALLGRDIDQA